MPTVHPQYVPVIGAKEIQFDITVDPVDHVPGRLSYNTQDDTLQFDTTIPGVRIQFGQEQQTHPARASGSDLLNGQAVYVSGATGINPLMSLAQANDPVKSRVLALATIDVLNGEFGRFTTFGLVRDFNTTAWAVGATLYLSATTPGGLTDTVPTGSGTAPVIIGTVMISHANQGAVLVHVGADFTQYLRHTGGTLTDVRETFYQEGGVSGSQEIDAGNGNHQEFTMTGNVTGQTFAGFTSGVSQTVVVDWIPNGFTMAWDAAIDWGTEGAPTTPPDGEWMRVWLTSRDGGTTVTGTARGGFTE